VHDRLFARNGLPFLPGSAFNIGHMRRAIRGYFEWSCLKPFNLE
jgi:hypothetical protein